MKDRFILFDSDSLKSLVNNLDENARAKSENANSGDINAMTYSDNSDKSIKNNSTITCFCLSLFETIQVILSQFKFIQVHSSLYKSIQVFFV